MDIHIYLSASQPEFSADEHCGPVRRGHSVLIRGQHTQADAKLNALGDFFTIQPWMAAAAWLNSDG